MSSLVRPVAIQGSGVGHCNHEDQLVTGSHIHLVNLAVSLKCGLQLFCLCRLQRCGEGAGCGNCNVAACQAGDISQNTRCQAQFANRGRAGQYNAICLIGGRNSVDCAADRKSCSCIAPLSNCAVNLSVSLNICLALFQHKNNIGLCSILFVDLAAVHIELAVSLDQGDTGSIVSCYNTCLDDTAVHIKHSGTVGVRTSRIAFVVISEASNTQRLTTAVKSNCGRQLTCLSAACVDNSLFVHIDGAAAILDKDNGSLLIRYGLGIGTTVEVDHAQVMGHLDRSAAVSGIRSRSNTGNDTTAHDAQNCAVVTGHNDSRTCIIDDVVAIQVQAVLCSLGVINTSIPAGIDTVVGNTVCQIIVGSCGHLVLIGTGCGSGPGNVLVTVPAPALIVDQDQLAIDLALGDLYSNCIAFLNHFVASLIRCQTAQDHIDIAGDRSCKYGGICKYLNGSAGGQAIDIHKTNCFGSAGCRCAHIQIANIGSTDKLQTAICMRGVYLAGNSTADGNNAAASVPLVQCKACGSCVHLCTFADGCTTVGSQDQCATGCARAQQDLAVVHQEVSAGIQVNCAGIAGSCQAVNCTIVHGEGRSAQVNCCSSSRQTGCTTNHCAGSCVAFLHSHGNVAASCIDNRSNCIGLNVVTAVEVDLTCSYMQGSACCLGSANAGNGTGTHDIQGSCAGNGDCSAFGIGNVMTVQVQANLAACSGNGDIGNIFAVQVVVTCRADIHAIGDNSPGVVSTTNRTITLLAAAHSQAAGNGTCCRQILFHHEGIGICNTDNLTLYSGMDISFDHIGVCSSDGLSEYTIGVRRGIHIDICALCQTGNVNHTSRLQNNTCRELCLATNAHVDRITSNIAQIPSAVNCTGNIHCNRTRANPGRIESLSCAISPNSCICTNVNSTFTANIDGEIIRAILRAVNCTASHIKGSIAGIQFHATAFIGSGCIVACVNHAAFHIEDAGLAFKAINANDTNAIEGNRCLVTYNYILLHGYCTTVGSNEEDGSDSICGHLRIGTTVQHYFHCRRIYMNCCATPTVFSLAGNCTTVTADNIQLTISSATCPNCALTISTAEGLTIQMETNNITCTSGLKQECITRSGKSTLGDIVVTACLDFNAFSSQRCPSLMPLTNRTPCCTVRTEVQILVDSGFCAGDYLYRRYADLQLLVAVGKNFLGAVAIVDREILCSSLRCLGGSECSGKYAALIHYNVTAGHTGSINRRIRYKPGNFRLTDQLA